jgi:hypothetical protein
MAYQPPKIKSGGGTTGTATIQMSSDGKKVRVTLDDGEKIYVLAKSDCPEYVQKGNFVVRMSTDGKKMQGCFPANGQFHCKVSKFVAMKDKAPAPKTFNGKDWSYEFFTVLLVITEGACKGMEIPYNLRYHFGDVDGYTGYTHTQSKYTPLLERFCSVTGVWNKGAITYTDNVLPVLEKRILRAANEFRVEMVDGWVDRLFPNSTVKSEPDPDADEIADPDESELPWSDDEDKEE